MAARGGRLRALVLVTLISFLLVQAALGLGAAAEFGRCYCNEYRKCGLQHNGELNCIKTAHYGCIKKFKTLCSKHPAGPADMGAAVVAAAGGRNLSEANGTGEETAA
ncbi:hypothetical protein ACQJBY_066293 [Aegilops geniculata]